LLTLFGIILLTTIKVHIKGLFLTKIGAAFRIEFSHERAGKQIRWLQSTRLTAGTLVALSPVRDNFRTICKAAIIAARPFEGGLDQNPPQIDIFWGKDEEVVFDPVERKSNCLYLCQI
jgi:helicase required for RNAi-mediated heterochromatin assembly 1